MGETVLNIVWETSDGDFAGVSVVIRVDDGGVSARDTDNREDGPALVRRDP